MGIAVPEDQWAEMTLASVCLFGVKLRALTGSLEYPEAVLSSDVVRDMECNASKLLSSH
jgi:hypothetical protein